ncbi:MAG TPA: PadR family transcriptional regulator [Solirubrobacterales bacterium]|nr:PadR family transcriptional regulator [Solirubrobacterales bacterium]
MSNETRLTPTSYIVLGLIEAAGEATPYDLKQVVARSLGNFWSLPHAQLYAEPERLTAGGHLEERREEGGRRRRYYKLTGTGRAALREWLAEPTAEMTELRDLAILKVFFGADPQQMAAAQLPARRAKAAEYEEIERNLAGVEGAGGPLLALRAGIVHERVWVDFWAGQLEGESTEGRSGEG